MKELRAVVNAFFLFAVFLLVWSWVRPGYATHARSGPRFLRMEVEAREHGHRERLRFSVPYVFVDGALRLAGTGNFRREMELHFDREVAGETVRELWRKLQETPDGQPVLHEDGSTRISLTRSGKAVVVSVDDGPARVNGRSEVTIRFPARLFEALAGDERSLDVNALIDELARGEKGDLVEVNAHEARVKVWVE